MYFLFTRDLCLRGVGTNMNIKCLRQQLLFCKVALAISAGRCERECEHGLWMDSIVTCPNTQTPPRLLPLPPHYIHLQAAIHQTPQIPPQSLPFYSSCCSNPVWFLLILNCHPFNLLRPPLLAPTHRRSEPPSVVA
ncbi:hypothetical protein EJ06DRAFT_231702 [Trichodelitschia bisporula]|uniref:Uncharacterized protein n=1 Tax=Trichodelitschia bisporula TaxID=703511 RepID=A0A6G1HLV0_9PEZI|nr:hypothetical protein EJ06DRAFT_231702 [Trichodelitschia bisporula]